jgi:hypothetical protein
MRPLLRRDDKLAVKNVEEAALISKESQFTLGFILATI